jgi:hypothetical protein
MDDNVVGAVQAPSIEAIRQSDHRPVELSSGYPPIPVLTGDQTPKPINRIAVRVPGGLAEH